MNDITIKSEPSDTATLWIAGDFDEIRRAVRAWVQGYGACVTVTRTEFCYVGGNETGARIGFEAYPRFPSKPGDSIWDKPLSLAEQLLGNEHLGQKSCLIVTPIETRWLTTTDPS